MAANRSDMRPRVGMIVDLGVRGRCRIVRVLRAGTIWVENIETGERWQVTGLAFA